MACEAHIWCTDRCHPHGTVGCPLELLLLPFALWEPPWKHNCFCEQKELVLEAVLVLGPSHLQRPPLTVQYLPSTFLRVL
jgi:hypothetical protein